jgi:hypothetical protein
VLNEVSRMRPLTTAEDLGTHEGNLDRALTTIEDILDSIVRTNSIAKSEALSACPSRGNSC